MNVLLIVVCPFALFLLAIVLSVFLRYIRILIAPLVSSNSSYAIFLLPVVIIRQFWQTSPMINTIFTSRNRNILVLSNLLVVNVIITGKLFSFQ